MIMNLKDCYTKFGGDFDEVLGRLRREQTFRNLYINSWTIKASSCLKHLWRIKIMKRLSEPFIHSKESVKISLLPDCLKAVVW